MAATAGTATDGSAPAVDGRRLPGLLALAAIVGVVASLASWGFLEAVHCIQVGLFTDLPKDLGYHSAPVWWPLPILAMGGVVVALAILRLPGEGGHVPAHGLNAGATPPVDLPGVVVAGMATIGLGLVLGPEAPLIALGGGLGLFGLRLARGVHPPQLGELLAACGAFAAVSLIFNSPVLAAILLIEATGLGGPKLPRVLVPGLLAAGIGSLISIGMGSWTGLSTSAYALGALPLPDFARPAFGDFAWSILLGALVAVGVFAVFRAARWLEKPVSRRLLVALPVVGLLVAGLAIGFSEATGKSTHEVLFSGQDQLPGLVSGAGAWSVGALALLVLCKGLAWSITLPGFRGGPTFPAMFLGAAGGIMASHLPGYATTPAVAVGIGAGVAATLKLPLSAVLIATVLTAHTGAGAMPLVIVGVVVAYLVRQGLDASLAARATHQVADQHPDHRDEVELADEHLDDRQRVPE